MLALAACPCLCRLSVKLRTATISAVGETQDLFACDACNVDDFQQRNVCATCTLIVCCSAGSCEDQWQWQGL